MCYNSVCMCVGRKVEACDGASQGWRTTTAGNSTVDLVQILTDKTIQITTFNAVHLQ